MFSKGPLIILYSTQCRYWDKTIDYQLQLINNLTDTPIFCIHNWEQINLPEQLQKFPHKYTFTTQTKELNNHIDYITEQCNIKPLLYNILSTKIALENAELLYRELYGRPIPDDYLILRLRPDVIIDTDLFPSNIKDNNEWISTWHSTYRPNIDKSPEMGDLFCLTTYKIMKAFTKIDISTIENICSTYRTKEWLINFSEQYLYCLLKIIDAKPILINNIHVYIQRDVGLHKYS
jgi:hypothetical protein